MREGLISIIRNALKDSGGQAAVWLVGAVFAAVGLGGLTTDLGKAYVVRTQLQNNVNAAALAAAGEVYNSSSTDNASTIASQYSGNASGDQNYNSYVGKVTTTVTAVCLNMLMPSGSSCGASSPANAVKVKQTASVPTIFMKLFGISALPVAAQATASMQGMAEPWNVVVVVDSTGSMATTDSNCGGKTEFQCALSGVQSLLEATNPCPAGVSSCSGSNARIRFSLFTFPNILTAVNGANPTVSGTSFNSLSNDINCGGVPGTYSNYKRQPLAAPYTLPKPGATLPVDSSGRTYMTYTQTSTGSTWTATYQITPFLSDYYNSANSSDGYLNPNSDLVKAVGYGSTKGCLTYTFGIDGSSGQGSNFGNTYFASVLYAAQSALTAEQQANPGSQNAIIFLSDGQANNSYYSDNKSAYGTVTSSNQYNEAYEFPSGPSPSEVGPTSTSYPVPAYLTPATTSSSVGYYQLGANGKGVYPDWYDQCQQAVEAARYAVNQGTRVYAVAYGSESSGCSDGWNIGATDQTMAPKDSYSQGFNQPYSSVSQILPCTTMEDIASEWSYFYSDNQQTGNVNLGCTDENHTTVSLQDIFQAISATFTTPRLLPNNAT